MYVPLLCGFVVFVLLAVFIGWAVDTSRQGNSERNRH
jgi:hypothetical protein